MTPSHVPGMGYPVRLDRPRGGVATVPVTARLTDLAALPDTLDRTRPGLTARSGRWRQQLRA